MDERGMTDWRRKDGMRETEILSVKAEKEMRKRRLEKYEGMRREEEKKKAESGEKP